MKLKYLFAFLLLIVAGVQSVKAQEAYACLVKLVMIRSLIR